MKIVILGLSITSSWGNGHATTYRGLVRELVARGHDVLFLERDVPWYAANRDLPNPPYCRTTLYSSLDELKDSFLEQVRDADFVMVGSYVPEGVEVGEWVRAKAQGADMVRAGYSPSVRLFEAAACATPIISDYWQGIETIFEIGKEILIANSPEEVLRYLRETPEAERCVIGQRACDRVLAEHTAAHRAAQLEQYIFKLSDCGAAND
jgi:spore maturation protein CgeB